MINEKIIIFFYVDDIIICYRKKNETKARTATSELQTKYVMNVLESLKWFLSVHVLQDKAKKLFWFLQETYIDKMTNQFVIDVTDKLSETSMTEKLFLNEDKVTNVSTHLYQKKTDSILFTIIITRSDVVFTASWLTTFNQNSEKSHHEAAD